jgi:hypothetical protein
LRAHAKRGSPATSSIAKENIFKPMKFLRNGHVRPIALAADIDIAGACFSLK